MYTTYSTLPCNPMQFFIMIMDNVSKILDAARVKSYPSMEDNDDLQTFFQLCNQMKQMDH